MAGRRCLCQRKPGEPCRGIPPRPPTIATRSALTAGLGGIGTLLLLPVASSVLGLHLGMGGRVVVTDADGQVDVAADSTHGLAGPHRPQWDRIVLEFADGTALRLVDKRRLGRATLNPDTARLGPDALQVTRAEFDAAVLRGPPPVKARLMDQTAISGSSVSRGQKAQIERGHHHPEPRGILHCGAQTGDPPDSPRPERAVVHRRTAVRALRPTETIELRPSGRPDLRPNAGSFMTQRIAECARQDSNLQPLDP